MCCTSTACVCSVLVQGPFHPGCNSVSVHLAYGRFRSKHPALMIITVSDATQVCWRGEGQSST